MRNKILLLSDEKDRLQFELVLQDFLSAGGEFFFAEKKASALEIVHKEHPQLVFIDHVHFKEEEWVGTSIVVLCEKENFKKAHIQFLLRPLENGAILDKCHAVFALLQGTFLKIPPM